MRQSGFTLVELLVVLVLIAIIAGIALPAFNSLIESQRRQDAAQQLVSGIRMARAEAIARNQVVVIAPIKGEWSLGWTTFVDTNRNGLMDDDEPSLAERSGYRNVKVAANSKVKHSIAFDSTGGSTNSGTGNGTLFICEKGRAASQHRVILAPSGRTRIANDEVITALCG
ncbi:GspH/FimT family pseudopilin [Pseudomonas huanghezhanensis]|uniref:GspH/FimT family pseudopilin n=1 Tax=Pseudomonas huanghezhanensis TaxID=3002903 RepID=UPI002286C91C|nr:GspH/FimT family protein [Pseudomonas sp. BSw22131]